MTGIHEALARLVSVIPGMSDDDSAIRALTCEECEALAGVVRACGRGDLADELLDLHKTHDAWDDEEHVIALEVEHEPLPLIVDERLVGYNQSIYYDGDDTHEARELYLDEGMVTQYRNAAGEWITLHEPTG